MCHYVFHTDRILLLSNKGKLIRECKIHIKSSTMTWRLLMWSQRTLLCKIVLRSWNKDKHVNVITPLEGVISSKEDTPTVDFSPINSLEHNGSSLRSSHYLLRGHFAWRLSKVTGYIISSPPRKPLIFRSRFPWCESEGDGKDKNIKIKISWLSTTLTSFLFR